MEERILFEASFEDTLGGDWEWLREAPEAWHVRGGALHMRALPGTLWGRRNDARNVLLRPAQSSAPGLTSELWVRNQPAQQGEQAGLIWFVDEGTYVKLIKECLEDQVWIVMGREEGDEPVLVNRVPVMLETVALRLIQADTMIIGQFRAAEDAPWQTVGTCALLPTATIQLGLFTHGGPGDVERWAEFSKFRIYVTQDIPG